MVESILSNSDIATLAEELKNATIDILEDDVKFTWEELRNKAITFLNNYNTLVENEKLFKRRKLLKDLINNPDGNKKRYTEYVKGSKEDYFVRAKYILAFDFDKYLNRFLEELPKSVLYTYEYNKKINTYQMSMIDLAKHITKEGRIFISFKQLMAEKKKALENEESNIISKEHIKQVKAAYAGVNARLGRYFEKVGGNLQEGLLMWKLENQWNIARVHNKGDIREAYTAALMVKHKTKLDFLCSCAVGKPKYYSHELIASFFYNYIHNVTNLPAIIEEDIVTDLAQYSAKTYKSSAPQLGQYLKVARHIKKNQSPLTKADLQEVIKKLFNPEAHRNMVIATVSEVSQASLKKILDTNKIKALEEIYIEFK